MEELAWIGFALVMTRMAIIMLTGLTGKGETKFAAGGSIGFIPLGLSNDPKLMRAGWQ